MKKKVEEKVVYKKFVSNPISYNREEIKFGRLIVYGNAYVYLYDKLDKIIDMSETIHQLPPLLNIKSCYIELLVKLKE